jgi:hypothetical protein
MWSGVELRGSDYGAIANCGENCIKILIPLKTDIFGQENHCRLIKKVSLA